jgi:hypothetical protein
VDPLGADVHHRWVPREIERERGRIAVDDAEPEARLIERAREVVDQRAVGLPRLRSGGGEGHELRESLELDARGELAAEVPGSLSRISTRGPSDKGSLSGAPGS